MAIPIQDVANRILNEADDQDREVFIDPVTIMLICSILSAIFNAARLYCQWKQGKSSAEGMKEVCEPGLFGRWRQRRARKMVADQIAHMDTNGQLNEEQRQNLVECVFKAGQKATVEEIQEIIDSEAAGWYGEWLV